MKKKTVLVVDDNIINRKILINLLKDKYSMIEASDGKEALDIINKHSHFLSCVLLDIVMPNMDGYEVLKQMSKNEEFSKIPVIVTTVQNNEESELKALSLGAMDFLPKPFNPVIIKQRITNLVNLRESSSLINAIQTDYITKAYSRQYFFELVKRTLFESISSDFDIVCIDIEKFTLIKEIFGIEKSEEVLRYVAKVISEHIGEDEFFGRIGTDIFAIFAKRKKSYSRETFLDRSIKINEFPIDFNITVKAGIYQITDKNIDVSLMCDRAIEAINAIKGKHDKHFCFYDQTVCDKEIKEKKIYDLMLSAVEKDQFIVFYQPKYNIVSGKIIGAEALVRWQVDENVFMSPDEFIPAFERNGFISTMDRCVWRKVVSTIQEMKSKDVLKIPISVNVAISDLFIDELPKLLKNYLDDHFVLPSEFHLEITESVYTNDKKFVLETLNKFKNYGFTIEMDDFGKGYSSLNMLSEIPIDVLKLDMGFLDNITDEKKAIIKCVVALGKTINKLTIAEGIETKEQIEFLKSVGVKFGQGYYFSKPLPKDEFFKLLENNK